MIFSNYQGDTTLKEAAKSEKFATELRGIDAWNRAYGFAAARTDPGFAAAMKAAVERFWMADMLR